MSKDALEFNTCFCNLVMYFKLVTISIFISVLTPILFAQSSEEERLRMEFVKSLNKKRIKENKNSERKIKPILANDTKQIASANQLDDEEVIKVETRLVRLDVLVYDEKGNTVLGLKPEDFIVTENSVPQEIGTFSLGSSEEVPRSIVLIMDYSNSQRPYIKTSVDSAKVLVDKLNPKDRMAIVTDDVELLVDFTNDKELLKNNLEKLRKKAEKGDVGKSLQYSSLYVTLKEMFDNEDIRPIIIFQTDGDQLFGVRPEKSPMDAIALGLTSFTDREMISAIEKSRVTIYSVISEFSLLGLSEDEQIKKATPLLEEQVSKKLREQPENIPAYLARVKRQQNAMVNIAKMSGGFTENLEIPSQADAIYENILKGITNRFLIGYYPTNQSNDGKRRNVKVEVKNHPEYVVLGRKFYFAPQEKTSAK